MQNLTLQHSPAHLGDHIIDHTAVISFGTRSSINRVQAAKLLSAGLVITLVATGVTHYLQPRSYASSGASAPITAVQKSIDSSAKSPVTPVQPQPVASTAPDSKALQAVLDKWQQDQASGSFSVAVQELGGQKRSASLQPDAIVSAASLYKLFLAQALYTQIDQGKLSLEANFGSDVNLGDCLERMIVWSDNDCGVDLASAYGWLNLDKAAHGFGFSQTTISGANTTTASDVAKFLVQLQSGKMLSNVSTKSLLDKMKRQAYRSAIPAGVPGITVADKIGDFEDIWNDAAIVYHPKGAYVLVALTKGSGTNAIKDLSTRVSTFFGQ